MWKLRNSLSPHAGRWVRASQAQEDSGHALLLPCTASFLGFDPAPLPHDRTHPDRLRGHLMACVRPFGFNGTQVWDILLLRR